jgi:alkylated DNA repair dioxygenase AlkB
MDRVSQLSLFDDAPPLPEGFDLRPDFVSEDEERSLLAWLETLTFAPYRHRGFDALREVAWFGERYDTETWAEPASTRLPPELGPLRGRAAGFAGVAPEALASILINRYAPGAPIGWHRDRPHFGIVVGVSLGAPCTFRFRRRGPDGRFARLNLDLPPRSIYRLSGPARHEWEHSIPPHAALRYSITLRTLTQRRG